MRKTQIFTPIFRHRSRTSPFVNQPTRVHTFRSALHYTFTFVVWLACGTAYSQGLEWFSTGSNWTYTYQSASGPEFFQSKLGITGQTQIAGMDCAKMELLENFGDDLFQCMPLAPVFYFFVRNDSVFFATDEHQNFRLGIDFNADVGEQWLIEVETINGLQQLIAAVQSREVVMIDGQGLTQITLTMSNAETGNPILEFPDPVVVIEKIGSIHSFFVPFGKYGFCDATANVQLQCFDSGDFQYMAPGMNSCTLGIESGISRTDEFRVYPNPTSDYVRIYEQGSAGVEFTIHVLDMSGRYMMVSNMKNGDLFNVSSLTPGMYFIQVQSGQNISVRRLVIATR